MINIPLLIAFIGAASVLTITPGIDTAIVLRAAMSGGRRSAAMAAIGITLGCLVWGAAVSLGLGVLLRASEVAYTMVKLAGAGYLIWSGFKLLCKPRVAISQGGAFHVAKTCRDAFRRGFLTNLLNPKVGIFYVTFLPQFVPVGVSTGIYCFFLACLHVLLTLIWFSVLIAATVPLTMFLRRPAVVRRLDQLTGGVFVAFGLRLAFSKS